MMVILLCLALQNPAALSREGAAAMRENRPKDAARAYRELIRLEPRVPQWRLNLGLALHTAGDLEAAVSELKAYLQANPAPGPAYWVLGIDQLKLGRACEAADALVLARKWRDSPELLAALADGAFRCKRYPEAAAYYAALGRKRDAARAHWLGAEYAKARALYAVLEAEFAADAAFQYEYGDTLLRIAPADAAIPHLEKARVLPEARASLGKAYAASSRWAEAVPLLEEGAKRDLSLLLPLSRAYQALGRTADAKRALDEYRAANP
jgi:predicted Zn-dependent protease